MASSDPAPCSRRSWPGLGEIPFAIGAIDRRAAIPARRAVAAVVAVVTLAVARSCAAARAAVLPVGAFLAELAARVRRGLLSAACSAGASAAPVARPDRPRAPPRLAPVIAHCAAADGACAAACADRSGRPDARPRSSRVRSMSRQLGERPASVDARRFSCSRRYNRRDGLRDHGRRFGNDRCGCLRGTAADGTTGAIPAGKKSVCGSSERELATRARRDSVRPRPDTGIGASAARASGSVLRRLRCGFRRRRISAQRLLPRRSLAVCLSCSPPAALFRLPPPAAWACGPCDSRASAGSRRSPRPTRRSATSSRRSR